MCFKHVPFASTRGAILLHTPPSEWEFCQALKFNDYMPCSCEHRSTAKVQCVFSHKYEQRHGENYFCFLLLSTQPQTCQNPWFDVLSIMFLRVQNYVRFRLGNKFGHVHWKLTSTSPQQAALSLSSLSKVWSEFTTEFDQNSRRSMPCQEKNWR